MKKLALGLCLCLAVVGCKASVKVQAKTPEPPPKQEQPAPDPPKEEPKAGDQIVLPEQIEFETDDSRIKETPKTLDTLQKLADIMKSHPGITKLRIEGHTDNTGRARHNAKLSQRRADAVASWLSQHSVDAARMTTKGFGASKPLVPNDSAEHRAQNRRTEYYVDEVDGKKVDSSKPVVVAAGTPTDGKTSN